jgi:hypothetical protein
VPVISRALSRDYDGMLVYFNILGHAWNCNLAGPALRSDSSCTWEYSKSRPKALEDFVQCWTQTVCVAVWVTGHRSRSMRGRLSHGLNNSGTCHWIADCLRYCDVTARICSGSLSYIPLSKGLDGTNAFACFMYDPET